MDLKEFIFVSNLNNNVSGNNVNGVIIGGINPPNSPNTYEIGTPFISDDVTDVWVYVEIFDDGTTGFVVNTDLIAEISLDNGTTYTPVTLINLGQGTDLANPTFRYLHRGKISTSGIPSTNQFKLRITYSYDQDFVSLNRAGALFIEPEEVSGGATPEEIWDYADRTLTSAGLSMSVSTVSFMAKAIAQGFNLANVEIANGGYNYFQFVNEKGFWHQVRESVNLLETRYAAGQPTKTTSANGWTNRATIDYSETADI